MKRNRVKPLFIIGCLITLTCAALVYASKTNPFRVWPDPGKSPKNGIVTLTGQMTQDKILYGGDGLAALALTMTADEVVDVDRGDARHVDMVVVLDRSGSMNGKKLEDALFDLVQAVVSSSRISSARRMSFSSRERLLHGTASSHSR